MGWLLGSGPGNELYEIWLELGALQGKEIRHFEIFNAVETTDGHTVRFYSDPDRLQDHLTELSPADARRIREFCQGLRQFRSCLAAYPFLRPVELMGKMDKVRMYLRFAPFYRLIIKSIATLMIDHAARFESPVLREAFNYVLYEKMPGLSVLPFYFQLACHADRTAGVPEGGSLGLAHSIEARYLSLGGQVRYNACVEEILVENDRAVGVRLSDGQRHTADVVVAAGDAHQTIAELLHGRYVSEAHRRPCAHPVSHSEMGGRDSPGIDPSETAGRAPPGIDPGETAGEDPDSAPGCFSLFLGVDQRFPEAEHCTTHLLTEDEAAELPGILHPSIHVQFRNRHYPELSPPGTSVIFATYACDVAHWRALHQGEDRLNRRRQGIEVHTLSARRGRSYPQEKRRVAEFLTGYLDRKYPGLARALVVRDVSTPLTQPGCTGNHSDTVLPWQPFVAGGDPLERERVQHGPVLPGLCNFYLAGAWGPTGGLVRAAAAGRHVMQFICKDDRKPFTAWIDDSAAPPSHVIVPPGGPRMAGPARARAESAPRSAVAPPPALPAATQRRA